MPFLRPALTGFTAGAFCVLPLYQGLWTACARAGLRFEPYPPDGVPLILVLALAGGLLGGVFALALPLWPRPAWQAGGLLGLGIALALWFVVAPLAGTTPASHPVWQPAAMAQTLSVFAIWGGYMGLALTYITSSIRNGPLRL